MEKMGNLENPRFYATFRIVEVIRAFKNTVNKGEQAVDDLWINFRAKNNTFISTLED